MLASRFSADNSHQIVHDRILAESRPLGLKRLPIVKLKNQVVPWLHWSREPPENLHIKYFTFTNF